MHNPILFLCRLIMLVKSLALLGGFYVVEIIFHSVGKAK